MDSRAGLARGEQALATLNEFGLAATQLLDLQAILELTTETLVCKLGMEDVMIYLWDEETRRYALKASRGVTPVQIAEIERRRLSGHDITQQVAETGNVVFVPDMADEPRFRGVWERLRGRSYVKLPLISRGTVVGVIGAVTPVGQALTFEDVEYLKIIGRQIGIAIDNSVLLAETRQREKRAMTLYRVGMKISASLALGDTLAAVANAAQELMGADIGLVGLVDEQYQAVIVQAVTGARSSLIFRTPMQIGEYPPWRELRSGRPFIAQGGSPSLIHLHNEDLVAHEEIQSLLVAPLLRGGRFLGLIEVLSRRPRPYKESDGRLLLRLAHQVVVAIENAHLYRQLHHLVVLEERDRLARELHDHLAQGLAYLKVKAGITEDLLSTGEAQQAMESLLELKKTAQILYTDVREQIFSLRTSVTGQENLFATLHDYLVDYQVHYGLDVRLLIDEGCPTEFAPEVAGQLLRIIQEALTNVRRHSNAAKVLILCTWDGGRVCVRIEDDGRGFLPAEVSKEGGQRYGLQIMRERAESVGGSLDLTSRPGQGTCVVVRVPALNEA